MFLLDVVSEIFMMLIVLGYFILVFLDDVTSISSFIVAMSVIKIFYDVLILFVWCLLKILAPQLIFSRYKSRKN